jgi:hypothetical protein
VGNDEALLPDGTEVVARDGRGPSVVRVTVGTDGIAESGDRSRLSNFTRIEDAVTWKGSGKVEDCWLEAAKVFHAETIFDVGE